MTCCSTGLGVDGKQGGFKEIKTLFKRNVTGRAGKGSGADLSTVSYRDEINPDLVDTKATAAGDGARKRKLRLQR